jgi:hypothetical protein
MDMEKKTIADCLHVLPFVLMFFLSFQEERKGGGRSGTPIFS